MRGRHPPLATMSRFHPHVDLSLGPPPELCAEVEAAWERARERSGEGLEVAIERDPASGRMAACVLGAAGGPGWRLSAFALLAFACGDLA